VGGNQKPVLAPGKDYLGFLVHHQATGDSQDAKLAKLLGGALKT
jgi:hypothetical protein